MDKRKRRAAAPKTVWRMSDRAPLGELMSPEQVAAASKAEAANRHADGHTSSWLGSSLELLGGTTISESPMDTLPGELIEAFFKR